ncbi:MAG: helix-turn-helix transcriptional regulator [Clostridiales bacterium]|jgi:AraC-like DNA-binding protein|nr:helix-turn-helix transcriptional regulator [Clostridiales bacterium]
MLLDQIECFSNATRLPVRLCDRSEILHVFAHKTISLELGLLLMPAVLCEKEPIGYAENEEQSLLGYVRVEADPSKHILIGPAFAYKPTQMSASKIRKKLGLPPSSESEIFSYIQFLPLYQTEQFKAILVLLDALVNGSTDRIPVLIRSDEDVVVPPVTKDARTTYLEKYDSNVEIKLLSCVRHGKTEELKLIFEDWAKGGGTAPYVTDDVLRSYKDIAINAGGVVSRAALDGGLDYDTINELSAYFLNKIESLNDYKLVSHEILRMFMTYANRVRSIKALPNDSALVKKIQKVIYSKMHEKVTPTIIAEKLYMDVSYLCKHFKSETGKTISEYVNEVKIEECCLLLETTDLSLREIAVQLGYSSQFYLSSTFKKVTGGTPMLYRKKNGAAVR